MPSDLSSGIGVAQECRSRRRIKNDYSSKFLALHSPDMFCILLHTEVSFWCSVVLLSFEKPIQPDKGAGRGSSEPNPEVKSAVFCWTCRQRSLEVHFVSVRHFVASNASWRPTDLTKGAGKQDYEQNSVADHLHATAQKHKGENTSYSIITYREISTSCYFSSINLVVVQELCGID